MKYPFCNSFALATGLMIAGAAAVTDAHAQWSPNRPVRFIVPFPPGGTVDVVGRIVASRLPERLGYQVVVDNRGGANAIIGTDLAAKAAPDGHTILIVPAGHSLTPSVMRKLPYDTLKDLTGVMLLTRFHMALYANPSFPANNPAELIALAKKEPGRVSYGSATTQSYLGMELLNSMAGTAGCTTST